MLINKSCKSSLVMMNFLSFCLFKVFIFPYFQRTTLVKYSILGWFFFSFNILNIPSSSLLACKEKSITVAKSTDSLMDVPLHVTRLVSCCLQMSHFVFDFDSLGIMSSAILTPFASLCLFFHMAPFTLSKKRSYHLSAQNPEWPYILPRVKAMALITAYVIWPTELLWPHSLPLSSLITGFQIRLPPWLTLNDPAQPLFLEGSSSRYPHDLLLWFSMSSPGYHLVIKDFTGQCMSNLTPFTLCFLLYSFLYYLLSHRIFICYPSTSMRLTNPWEACSKYIFLKEWI